MNRIHFELFTDALIFHAHLRSLAVQANVGREGTQYVVRWYGEWPEGLDAILEPLETIQ